jgi:hypothetical protein
MNKLIASLVVFIAFSVGIATADWQLAWEDEFDGGNLADRWNFELGCSGNVINVIKLFVHIDIISIIHEVFHILMCI